MQGKGLSLFAVCAGFRITPAYAGKSAHNAAHGLRSWDHPRLCGEKSPLPWIAAAALGSPPRMRGKAIHCPQGISMTWITPAYAGKSDYSSGRNLSFKDHPRVCGKRTSFPCPRPAPWDHPRVCGEKSAIRQQSGLRTGSPPRMRGKATK